VLLVTTISHILFNYYSTRVSNELGAGRPQAARLATRAVKFLALCIGVSEGLVVVLLRNIWGHAYSNDREVTKYTTRMMPLVAASIMLDCQQSSLSGNQKKGETYSHQHQLFVCFFG